MSTPVPTHRLERLFAQAASDTLPLGEAVIRRNSYGILSYFWTSPCEALAGLYVNISKHEIMLSNRLFHSHIDHLHFLPERVPNKDLPKRIADEGVAEALRVMNGEVVFIKKYDADGNEDSSSGMSPRHLWNDPRQRSSWTAFEGKGWTARAWDWRGEVTDL